MSGLGARLFGAGSPLLVVGCVAGMVLLLWLLLRLTRGSPDRVRVRSTHQGLDRRSSDGQVEPQGDTPARGRLDGQPPVRSSGSGSVTP